MVRVVEESSADEVVWAMEACMVTKAWPEAVMFEVRKGLVAPLAV